MKIFRLCAVGIFLVSCHKAKDLAVPELVDPPAVAQVQTLNLPETAPGHGIATYGGGGLFEVNIESDDTAKVKIGQSALIFSSPGSQPVRGRVVRLLKGVSSETGQSLAWLKAEGASPIPQGEFIFATITVGQRPHVLALPARAILVRGGKSWVIAEVPGEKPAYAPVEVRTGVSAGDLVEIVSGLKSEQSVVTDAGLGFLFPDFKSQAEAD